MSDGRDFSSDGTTSPRIASVLAINGGSSSVKFAIHEVGTSPAVSFRGRVVDHDAAASRLIEWLEAREEFAAVRAVGHRVVHGMAHTEPERVTLELLDELRRAIPYAPEHLPREIELIEAFRERHPHLPQVACFDTAFHGMMPRVATLLPIPRRYQAKGVQRYGFHGLSYAYLVEELARVAGPEAAHGRLILAHLGNGASLAAVREGTSIDTTMGFTPAAGLVMGTRTGDLDPRLVSFLAHS
jgi:acetate kinase